MIDGRAGTGRGRPLRVAVSGINLGENAQPGPGVIRSLREALGARLEVVGIAYDAFDSSLHVPGLLDEAFLMPYPSAGARAWLERLAGIHAESPIDVLVPCLDVELPLLIQLKPDLEALGVRTVLPTKAALARRSKERLSELAAQAGIATPETLAVGNPAALAAAAAQLGYPLLVKGPFYEAEVVRSLAEAQTAYAALSARWGLPLLAQRFVAGEEYDVTLLGDGRGGGHGAVAMRKTVLTRQGKAWGAITVVDRELVDAARRVVGVLHWLGGCEVEMLRATSDGRLHLIEVNPRFPAWIYLATAAGVNLPLGLVKLALGEDVPRWDGYRAGVFYVRHAVEAIGDTADIEALLTGGRRQARARCERPGAGADRQAGAPGTERPGTKGVDDDDAAL